MRYEVSYVEHGHAEADNPFTLKLLLGQLDDVSARLTSFQATRGDGPFRVTFHRRWAVDMDAASEVEALRTFLHVRGLPEGLNFRDIVVRPVPVDPTTAAGDAA